jgi:hypothetical protein
LGEWRASRRRAVALAAAARGGEVAAATPRARGALPEGIAPPPQLQGLAEAAAAAADANAGVSGGPPRPVDYSASSGVGELPSGFPDGEGGAQAQAAADSAAAAAASAERLPSAGFRSDPAAWGFGLDLSRWPEVVIVRDDVCSGDDVRNAAVGGDAGSTPAGLAEAVGGGALRLLELQLGGGLAAVAVLQEATAPAPLPSPSSRSVSAPAASAAAAARAASAGVGVAAPRTSPGFDWALPALRPTGADDSTSSSIATSGCIAPSSSGGSSSGGGGGGGGALGPLRSPYDTPEPQGAVVPLFGRVVEGRLKVYVEGGALGCDAIRTSPCV